MLVTLGFIALLVGVVLVICGYTVAPRALHPGVACVVLAVVLLLLGYLLPDIAAHHDSGYDGASAGITLIR